MDTFMCGVCSLSFDCYFTLLKHKTEHIHKDQKMKCPFCCKTISKGNDLAAHLRLTHSVDVGFDPISSETQSTSSQTELPVLDQKKVDISLHKTTEDKVVKANFTNEIKKSIVQQKITVIENDSNGDNVLISEACPQFQHQSSQANQIYDVLQSKSVGLKLSSSSSQTSSELDASISPQQKMTHPSLLFHQNISDLNWNDPCQLVSPVTADGASQMKCPTSAGLISDGTAKKGQLSNPSFQPHRHESKQSEAGVMSSLTTQTLMKSLSNLDQSTSASITAVPPISQAKIFANNGVSGIENQSVLNSQEMLSSDRCIILDHNNTHSKESSSDFSKLLNVDISENTLNIFSKNMDELDHSDVIKLSSSSIQVGNNSQNGSKCGNCIFSNYSKHSDKESTQPDLTDFYFLLGTVSIQGNSMTYERTEFRCLHCKFSTAWRPSLVKHMKGVHKEILDIHCVLEMRNAKSADKVHESPNLVKSRSNYKVLKMSEYVILQKRTKNRPHRPRKLNYQDLPGHYPCLTCHKVFTRLRYLRRHHIVHRGERSHQCDLCGKCFKTRAVLGSHRCANLADRQKTCFHCPQCSFTSNSRTAVHKHRQLHPCGAMLCHVCGAAYPDRSTLRRHIRVHDPSRPFACGHIGCTWRFKTEMMCRAHERGHNLSQSASKFQCTFCGYNFRQKHHLQRHVAKFHSANDDGATLPLSSSPTTSARLFPHPQQSLTLNQITTDHRKVPIDIAQDIGNNFFQSDQRQSKLVICIDNSDIQQISSPTPLPALSSVEGSSNNLQRSDHSYLSDHFQDHEVFLASHSSSVKQEDGVEAQRGSLEIIQGECDLVELLKSGILMAHDQHGNLVHYKVADIGNVDSPDMSTASTGQQLAHNSAPVYFIDVGNSY